MNLVKSRDYFNPYNLPRCHIIGCGSVGSTIAELLARLGITKISLYDFDIVSSHNLANQMFRECDVKRLKVDAVRDLILSINPEADSQLKTFETGWNEKTRLNGFVFLAVDNIDLRREIVMRNKDNKSINAVFDVRTRLEEGQHFAANWSDYESITNLINSMQFSHEEAKEATPVTACNVEIGVAPTVRVICSYCVTNFMNFVKTGNLKKLIIANAFNFIVDAY